MTNNQLFLSLAGLLVALNGLMLGYLRWYIDAKIDPVAKNVEMLVQYMILHQGKIERLDERTEHLKRTGEK